MSTLTRTMLTTGAMLVGVAAAAAQAPGPRRAVLVTERPVVSVAVRTRSPAAVIERLVSFDVDADGRVSRDELPERMQGLVPRGDRNADAALDSDEIRALVTAASSGPARISFRPERSDGLAGVINDLRLPPLKHARALLIVDGQKLPGHVDNPAASGVLGEMKALLDAEEYENFLAAATRLSRGADIRFRTVGGVVGGVLVSPGRK